MMLGVYFIICTGIIFYSGIKLSEYGDIIAEKTGLGRAWIGMVLLATVTSLPELVTGITAVTYTGAPDIAVGNVLGSCVLNMLILAMLDAVKPVPISSRAHFGNILTAGFATLLLVITAAGIYLGKFFYPAKWIGSYSFLIFFLYFIAVRSVYFFEKKRISEFIEEVTEVKYEKVTFRKAGTGFVINALVVITAAIFLPGIGEGIARQTGLGETFVGNIIISLSTALPEMVVSLSAAKMDAVDLAVGNLFGSIIFNIFILGIDDLFFLKGPILSFVKETHLIPVFSAIAMASIAIIGLTYRASRKRLILSWDSLGIVLIYIFNLILLYLLR